MTSGGGLRIDVEWAGDACEVVLHGALSAAGVRLFDDALELALEQAGSRHHEVVLDLRDVVAVDARGEDELRSVGLRARRAGCQVRVLA
ncbi:hypothetical protein AB1207_15635 [Kineococcus endophyticus]|uniref:STAS domain-containing protein n=1 Tax=Kineococcus endophyticus TaxID=1181883 RepID=A0ABV3P9Y8_9ACTN